jgi:hypothetical protein
MIHTERRISHSASEASLLRRPGMAQLGQLVQQRGHPLALGADAGFLDAGRR